MWPPLPRVGPVIVRLPDSLSLSFTFTLSLIVCFERSVGIRSERVRLISKLWASIDVISERLQHVRLSLSAEQESLFGRHPLDLSHSGFLLACRASIT